MTICTQGKKLFHTYVRTAKKYFKQYNRMYAMQKIISSSITVCTKRKNIFQAVYTHVRSAKNDFKKYIRMQAMQKIISSSVTVCTRVQKSMSSNI